MAAQDTEARLRPAPPLSLEPEVRPAPLAALRLKQGMPTDFHFVRSHFGVPLIDHSRVALDLGGAVKRELHLSLRELLGRPSRSLTVVLECAGHRRKEFSPATAGLPWSTGQSPRLDGQVFRSRTCLPRSSLQRVCARFSSRAAIAVFIAARAMRFLSADRFRSSGHGTETY